MVPGTTTSSGPAGAPTTWPPCWTPNRAYRNRNVSRPSAADPCWLLRSADGFRWEKMQEEPVISDGAFDSLNIPVWDHVRGRYLAIYRDFTEGVRTIKIAEVRRLPELDSRRMGRFRGRTAGASLHQWNGPVYPGSPISSWLPQAFSSLAQPIPRLSPAGSFGCGSHVQPGRLPLAPSPGSVRPSRAGRAQELAQPEQSPGGGDGGDRSRRTLPLHASQLQGPQPLPGADWCCAPTASSPCTRVMGAASS